MLHQMKVALAAAAAALLLAAPASAATVVLTQTLNQPLAGAVYNGTFDVSGLLSRELKLDQAADRLMDDLVRTCNGRLTSAEALGHREFVMTKLYPSA